MRTGENGARMRQPNMKPRHDVAIAIVHRNGRWLVALRRPDAHLGGLWEFPGGKLHDGESATDAALRELREECAVEADVERVLPPVEHDYGDRRVRLTAVLCRWRSGEPQPLSGEVCRWVTRGELAELAMPALNAEIIAAATGEAQPRTGCD